ncbi:MAG: tetratricopeptide repeat protein, partial [Anaerolineae bacterium]|nr:tetratricopeptide repeat protein [Anaerolineae bacterium]
MPEISLQAYENEIDQLIEQARYLEALAHVRCILGQYPRYIGAYCLLGETMLEVDLPGLAADMFRRALSANPEHLMARIGLGLAHEHSNNLDASIWNLLRALELNSGNNDIGEELRRMYGRRDGLEPDYIPRTPAGLARLYIKGDRSGRAVTQLRALLDEEPARPDLMTALAEAYWRNGQIVQASDMCQEILDKMPHNCKANLLLGTLWVNGGQEEGWAYLQRAQEVDPENTMAEALFGSDSLLEPRPVNLDRLVYDPDAIEVDQESAWFKRLGTASVTAGISEAPPEMTESEMRLVDITADLESQIEIPDWLRELGAPDEEDAGGLGWMADLSPEVTPEVSEDFGLVEGEVFGVLDAALPLQESLEGSQLLEGEAEEESPDWLQELTIQEMPFDLDESEGAPDWLMQLVGEEGGAEDTPPALVETAAEDSSDRLAGLPAEEDAGDLDALAGEAVSGEDAAWLADLGTVDETDAGALDWLGELQSTVVEEGAAGIVEAATDEADVSGLGDVPDWMKALEPETEAGAVAPVAAEDQAASEDEAVPEWLAGLAPATAEAEPAVGAESEIGDLEEGAVPDWMVDLAPEAEIGEAASEEVADAAPVDAGISDWLSALTESVDEAAEPSGVAVEEEMPDWLRDLDVGEGEPAGESLTVLGSLEFAEPDVEGDGVLTGAGALGWPDTLTADREEDQPVADVAEGAVDDETVEVTIPTSEVAEIEVLPVDAGAWADEVPDEQFGMLSGDDAVAWLQSLTVGKEEELRALAEAESEARIAEILGPKAETSPSVPVEEPAEVDAEVAAPAEAELEEAEGEIAPLREEDEPLSGDDALAWLESLAAGGEEELQAQAEPEPVVVETPETVAEAPEIVAPASAAVASDTAVETAVG